MVSRRERQASNGGIPRHASWSRNVIHCESLHQRLPTREGATNGHEQLAAADCTAAEWDGEAALGAGDHGGPGGGDYRHCLRRRNGNPNVNGRVGLHSWANQLAVVVAVASGIAIPDGLTGRIRDRHGKGRAAGLGRGQRLAGGH